MDKSDFLRWYTLGDQLVPNILIDAGFQPHRFLVNFVLLLLVGIILLSLGRLALRLALRRGQIGEDKLRPQRFRALLPDVEHVLNTSV